MSLHANPNEGSEIEPDRFLLDRPLGRMEMVEDLIEGLLQVTLSNAGLTFDYRDDYHWEGENWQRHRALFSLPEERGDVETRQYAACLVQVVNGIVACATAEPAKRTLYANLRVYAHGDGVLGFHISYCYVD